MYRFLNASRHKPTPLYLSEQQCLLTSKLSGSSKISSSCKWGIAITLLCVFCIHSQKITKTLILPRSSHYMFIHKDRQSESKISMNSAFIVTYRVNRLWQFCNIINRCQPFFSDALISVFERVQHISKPPVWSSIIRTRNSMPVF
jgi:hypothetical protein